MQSRAPMSEKTDQTALETAASASAEAPARRLRVGPLLALVPYVMRYRGQVIGALIALLVAAAASLAVPLAVRRMIDFGFSAERIGLIDQYFAVMIAVAGVLAAASALRFYLVTIIGERVVADLRTAVFAHLTELSPAFFDTAKTGELTSRLTADTIQIKSAVGSSVSVALRNIVLFVGSSVMMVVTSPRLRSEEHTSELQSHSDLVCRLLLEKKKKNTNNTKCLSQQLIYKSILD